MSAEAIGALSHLAVSIRPRERTLLTVMATLADSDGHVQAAQDRLARECGWAHIDHVRTVTNMLLAQRLIEVITHGRRGTPRRYRLKFLPVRG